LTLLENACKLKLLTQTMEPLQVSGFGQAAWQKLCADTAADLDAKEKAAQEELTAVAASHKAVMAELQAKHERCVSGLRSSYEIKRSERQRQVIDCLREIKASADADTAQIASDVTQHTPTPSTDHNVMVETSSAGGSSSNSSSALLATAASPHTAGVRRGVTLASRISSTRTLNEQSSTTAQPDDDATESENESDTVYNGMQQQCGDQRDAASTTTAATTTAAVVVTPTTAELAATVAAAAAATTTATAVPAALSIAAAALTSDLEPAAAAAGAQQRQQQSSPDDATDATSDSAEVIEVVDVKRAATKADQVREALAAVTRALIASKGKTKHMLTITDDRVQRALTKYTTNTVLRPHFTNSEHINHSVYKQVEQLFKRYSVAQPGQASTWYTLPRQGIVYVKELQLLVDYRALQASNDSIDVQIGKYYQRGDAASKADVFRQCAQQQQSAVVAVDDTHFMPLLNSIQQQAGLKSHMCSNLTATKNDIKKLARTVQDGFVKNVMIALVESH
jgi:hypothetical protein